jgi:hypothetical protein
LKIVLKNIKKMNKIPTAEDLLKQIYNEDSGAGGDSYSQGDIERLMIEFAKYHVEQALKEASEKAEWSGYALASVEIDKDSILDAYPLENIK